MRVRRDMQIGNNLKLTEIASKNVKMCQVR